ncbi:hypothetical protein MKX03_020898 [Papaver bracteatum]|nr:hypothetical protein MKX03_020898 [Papaver bracteatum]
MSISNNEFPQDTDESDSEINLDENPDYYQPISSDGDEEIDSDPNLGFQVLSNGLTESAINDEEEEEVIEESINSEISRAFREDENRRKTPLTPENSNRIMDAMRGISLQGFVPDWSNQVPESNWIDQLRNLRLLQQQPLSSTSSISSGTRET